MTFSMWLSTDFRLADRGSLRELFVLVIERLVGMR